MTPKGLGQEAPVSYHSNGGVEPSLPPPLRLCPGFLDLILTVRPLGQESETIPRALRAGRRVGTFPSAGTPSTPQSCQVRRG